MVVKPFWRIRVKDEGADCGPNVMLEVWAAWPGYRPSLITRYHYVNWEEVVRYEVIS